MGIWKHCAAGLAVLLFWQPAALAARAASIVRGTGAGSDKAAGYISHFLWGEVQKQPGLDTIVVADALGDPGFERAQRAFENATDGSRRALEAYQNLDIDKAVNLLNGVLTKYQRHAAYVSDFRDVAGVLMLLGACHLLRGEDRTARRLLADAVLLVPGLEPDPSIFNTSMRDAFDRAVKRLSKRRAGGLSVSSNPSYARVYVDGEFAGVTPVLLEGVTAGNHYLRLVKDGYRSWGNVVEVNADGESDINATMKPTTGFEDFDTLADGAIAAMAASEFESDPAMSDAIDQLGVMLNVDHLFLCQVKLDGERVNTYVVHYDLNGGRPVARGSQSFSYDSRPDTYAREVSALFEGDLAVTLKVAGVSTPVEATSGGLTHAGSSACMGMSCSTFKVVTLGVGVGGGAVLMGVGGLMWGLGSKGNTTFRETVQTSPNLKSDRSGPRNMVIAGDALFFTGAALAVVGLVATFIWQPNPTTEDVAESGSGFGFALAPTPTGWMLGGAGTF